MHDGTQSPEGNPPPRTTAKIVSRAFIYPNSLARLNTQAKQGMYIIITRARTIIWAGDIPTAKLAV